MNRIKGNDNQQFDEIIRKAIDKTQFGEILTPGADVEFSIEHGFLTSPIGFIVIGQDKAASVYNGTTAWDEEKIFLKCNVAATTIRILIF